MPRPRHDRKAEPDHVDTLCEQVVCHGRSERCIAKHHWDDGVNTRDQVKASSLHPASELRRDAPEVVSALGACAEHVDRSDRRRHDGRRDCVGEEVWAAALAQHGDDHVLQVNPPLAPPSALPSVLVRMSTFPMTPQWSMPCAPSGPKKPVAWLSSTWTMAP